jgi:colanic acid biosynthesis glycosyl transferase WcaI
MFQMHAMLTKQTNVSTFLMKLVFVNRFYYPDVSATSQMLTDVSLFLARQGHEVHVVTSRLAYEGGGKGFPHEQVLDGVQIHRIWTTAFGRSLLLGRSFDYLTFYISVFSYLLRHLKREDLVIAKTDPPLLSVPCSWAARVKGATQVNWLQDLFPEVAKALNIRLPDWLFTQLAAVRNQSLRYAQTNIVLGNRMRTRLLSESVPKEQIVVIHNWADGDQIRPMVASPVRAQWQLDGKFVVGYSGNLGRAHEIETLLGAMRALRSETDIVFLIIGGGVLAESLKQVVVAEKINNVSFRPYQPREMLNQTLTLPDVHLIILRPEVEGLIVPSKIYGVLAAGRASIFIGDHAGEIAKILADHDAGISVDTLDKHALKDAILMLKTQRDRCDEMGRNARTAYEQCYSMARSLEKLEEVLC